MASPVRKYDLSSQAFFANAYATFSQMRENDPVYRQPGVDGEKPIWFVTRYEDVEAVLLDDKRFVRDPRLAFPPAFFSGFQEEQQVLRFGVHGEDEDLGTEAALTNHAGCVKAAHARHLDIHDDDVGFCLARGIDGGRAVGSLAYDFYIRFGIQ